MAPIDDFPIRLGRILRKARTSKGLSQEKLAELAGLHRTYIGMVERGEKNISLINYVRISLALDTPPQEFIAELYNNASTTTHIT
ncbi:MULTISPECIES: helix-turn-helix domain-containing protein [Prosthecochloris]|uniref:Helix-turn-helix transcriptional regulator n=1 Tax=Prosthecochloris vibrioformis TaxID=1098 RepID=A0A5C4S051_PROVB|nr:MULTISPECIES: helix-turn-helix transcriptional regulator [Prosthecochloris]ANT64110.1 anaerobic benzoate catabolism transcriptional regulator [Prosthecochloris sp. CIB 2401]TNJ36387.1 helix-turn-helix transcriptional regulator [Prosthecochloris vibrioformis]